ncbi:MAG: TIGR00282 family metallophosphoesterase [Bacillota bacterium]
MKLLFIGDIVGKPGRRAVRDLLPELQRKLGMDLVIANAENAAGGFGVTREVVEELLAQGIDLLTMGNHTWANKEVFDLFKMEMPLIRPANFPPENPGKGYYFIKYRDKKAAVINLQGRTYMTNIECPFRTADALLSSIREETNLIIVDFHAEASSEKIALGWYLDGRISLLAGTHTHVQTADERIFPRGMGYITDVGMTGPIDSVLGVEKELVIDKFLRQLPVHFQIAKGDAVFSGLFARIHDETGNTLELKRIYCTIRNN